MGILSIGLLLVVGHIASAFGISNGNPVEPYVPSGQQRLKSDLDNYIGVQTAVVKFIMTLAAFKKSW